MATLLYDLGIGLYGLLARLMAPWHRKARLMVQGRQAAWAKLEAFGRADSRPVAWFHCASLGEFEQGRPVLEAFRQAYPGWRILLTFFSPSGYEVRQRYAHADCVAYLPADTRRHARRLLEAVPIGAAFFVKYEFWHHYLSALKARRVPAISFAAIFRPGQRFFRPYGGFARESLRAFSHIFVQDAASQALLAGIGIVADVAPDTRFDRVAAIAASPQHIEPAARFSRHAPTLVIGSAWPADLERIGPALARWEGPLRLVVAPHEVDEATLRQVERLLRPLPCLRYSQAAEAPLDQASVLLIDNIGMLSSLYQYGKWAYIGGGFGKGLHNTLEAATFGLPVLFGPNHRKFREALELQEAGAAFSVGTADDFAEAFGRLYGSEAFTAQASAAARSYVRARLGGTEAIMAKASALLS